MWSEKEWILGLSQSKLTGTGSQMGEGAWWQEEKSQDQTVQTSKSVTEETGLEKHNNTFLKAYPPLKWRETMADESYS